MRKMRKVLRLTHALGMSGRPAGEVIGADKSGAGQSTSVEKASETRRACPALSNMGLGYIGAACEQAGATS